MRLLPIFFVAAFAASGTSNSASTENSAPVSVERRLWANFRGKWFGDESQVERRGWSFRSMLRKALKKMHGRVSNRYISALMKKYHKKNLMKMIAKFGEE